MCDKRSTVRVVLRGKVVRVDPCIRALLLEMNGHGIETLGSCCGHGRYGLSVVLKMDGRIVDLGSGAEIPRVRRFYRRDATGFYYIPEAR